MDDSTYARRAAAAAAAAPPPPPCSALDELNGVLDDPPAAARREVAHESLDQLHTQLCAGEARILTLAEAHKRYRDTKGRLMPVLTTATAEKAWGLHKRFARFERYIQLLQQQEEQHRHARRHQEPQWQGQQHPAGFGNPFHGPTPRAGPPPQPFLEHGVRGSSQQPRDPPGQSKAWLAQAQHNQEEYRSSPTDQPLDPAPARGPQGPGTRQAYVPMGTVSGRHDYTGLQDSPAAAPTADRGAAAATKQLTARHGQLLGVSAAGRGKQHQQGRQQQQQQQGARKGQLPLKTVPSERFHNQAASAPNASLAARAPAGLGAVGLGRVPTRGKGKQQQRAQQQRGSDGEYDPQADRLAQRQGRRSGKFSALQGDSDQDEELHTMMYGNTGRNQAPRRVGMRRGPAQQPVDTGPVLIDLLSDEEQGAADAQQGSAERSGGSGGAEPAPPPERRERPARANAYRTTSEKFKGLKCLYPPTGGPGSVEVTHLDLPRLDPDEFLNDTVIDFYLRWLQDQLPPEVAERCYFFNTFFFKKLTETSGGGLTDEVESWAAENEIKGEKLQTLRNHQKVKKWTKDVDLFSKDFIFVPVHEALHWSLMLVCHPGVVLDFSMEPKDRAARATAAATKAAGPRPAPGDKASAMSAVKPGQKTPCILHMDSIKGSHNVPKVTNKLRLYLSYEWDLKALFGPEGGVPRRWAEAHPGMQRTWRPTQDFPSRSVKVPKQDNHCDCGLFMCSYPEFFTYRLPPNISLPEVEALVQYGKTNRDLFEGTDFCYPGMLTEHWFPDSNPTSLRQEMRRQILELMAEQNNLRDPITKEWDESNEVAQEVKQELLHLSIELGKSPYQRPSEYLSQAETKKSYRRAALVRRQREEEDRKAGRQKRQAGAKKGLGGTADRDLLAQAAEQRLGSRQGGGGATAGSNLFASLAEIAAQGDDEFEDFNDLPRPNQQQQQQQRQQREQRPEEVGAWPASQQEPGSQPDANFAVDLEYVEEEAAGGGWGNGAAAGHFSAPAEAQQPAQQAQRARRRSRKQVLEEDSEAEGLGEGVRGAGPGSPPREGQQQQQQGEGGEGLTPPARKRGRRSQQKPQLEAPLIGPAVGWASGAAAAAEGAAPEESSDGLLTQDAGGSDSELEIVQAAPAEQVARQPKRQRVGRRRAGTPQPSDARGRSMDVEWDRVVAVAGQLWQGPLGGNQYAGVRIWYPTGDQHVYSQDSLVNFAVLIDFKNASTAASVAMLRAWQQRHEAQLAGLGSSKVDFAPINLWEEQQQEQQQQEQQQEQEPSSQGTLASLPASPDLATGRPLEQERPAAAVVVLASPEQGWQGAADGSEGWQEAVSSPVAAPADAGGQTAAAGDAALAAQEMEGLHLEQQQQRQRRRGWDSGPAVAAGAAAHAPAAAQAGAHADVVDVTADEEEEQQQQRQQQALRETQGANGTKAGKRKQQQPLQHQHAAAAAPPSKLARKSDKPRRRPEAAGPAEQAQVQLRAGAQQAQQASTASFNKHLCEPEAAATQAPHAASAGAPASFGLPVAAPKPAALRMMAGAGSTVLQHASPALGRPGSKNPQWRRVSGDQQPGQVQQAQHAQQGMQPPALYGQQQQQQQQQQQSWDFGRPAAHDARMAAAPQAAGTVARQQYGPAHQCQVREAAFMAVEEAAAAAEQSIAQQGQPQHHQQQQGRGTFGQKSKHATAALFERRKQITATRQAEEQAKLRHRPHKEQQAATVDLTGDG